MLYPGRYDWIQLKERIFQGVHPHLRDSMQFLYMKEDVGYEEFLAPVYEAGMEGSEGKVVNVKAEALTVEKINDNKEQNELKDLKQQIVVSYNNEKHHHGKGKVKSDRGSVLPKEKRSTR